MSTAPASTSAIGHSPEFTLTHEPHRRRWVIRRHGAYYLGIPTDDYSERYARRVVDLLNKET